MKWSVMVKDTEQARSGFKEISGKTITSFLGRGELCGMTEMVNSTTQEVALLLRFQGNVFLFLNQFFSCNVLHNANPIYIGWPRTVET